MTEPKQIVQEAVEKVSGYKFYAGGQEVSYGQVDRHPMR